jgi:hypothetical protein
VLIDVMIALLRPTTERTWARHAVALAGPLVLIGLYLVAVWWRVGIGWSIEMWSGTIMLGMFGGLALSVLTSSGASAPHPATADRRAAPADFDEQLAGFRPSGIPDDRPNPRLDPALLDELRTPSRSGD